MTYKLEQNELLMFAQKVYEEACCGYIDLKESVCDALVREFLDGKQDISTNNETNNTTMIVSSMPSNFLGTESYSVVNNTTAYDDLARIRSQEYIRSVQRRSEEYIQNFQGNESERI